MASSSGLSKNNSLLSIEIKGARELEAALMALGQDRLIKATMRRALLEAAELAVPMAQRLAPKGTPPRMATKIQASTTLARRQRRGGRYRASVNTAYVWLGAGSRGPGVLQEFGTGPRYQRKTGKFTGATPASPFLRPAWEANKVEMLDLFADRLWVQIEKSARRLARRQAKAAGIKL